jgi:EEF1A N-terminal glycine/lysine methyltransferase
VLNSLHNAQSCDILSMCENDTHVRFVMGAVIELGAGCALPTLLAATLASPPSVVVITDYPDETILGSLRRNVERNRVHFTRAEAVHWVGYEWGADVTGLLDL